MKLISLSKNRGDSNSLYYVVELKYFNVRLEMDYKWTE